MLFLAFSVALSLSDIVIRPSDMLLDGTDYNYFPGMDDHLTSDTMVSTGFEAPVPLDVPASEPSE